MSKTDAARWNDWRSTKRRPLRPARSCKCGREFMPDVFGQTTCRVCCGVASQAEKAPVTADEIERERMVSLLEKALADHASYRPVELADPPSDQAKLWRKASKRSTGIESKHRRKSKPPRGMTKQMAQVALKSVRSGMSLRKVAKRLNVNEQVVKDWAILTADDMRYRAACQGKYQQPMADQTATGKTFWTLAKQGSKCNQCGARIFPGDKISRPDKRWIHSSCASSIGYVVCDADGKPSLSICQ